jgi:hypothetical protein
MPKLENVTEAQALQALDEATKTLKEITKLIEGATSTIAAASDAAIASAFETFKVFINENTSIKGIPGANLRSLDDAVEDLNGKFPLPKAPPGIDLNEIRESSETLAHTIEQSPMKSHTDLSELAADLRKLTSSILADQFKQFCNELDGLTKNLKSKNADDINKLIDAAEALKNAPLPDINALNELCKLKEDFSNAMKSRPAGIPTADERALLRLEKRLEKLVEELMNRGPGNGPGNPGIKNADKVRQDYPILTDEQKRPILTLFKNYSILGDPNFSPGRLEPAHVIDKLSAFQKDPNNPTEDWRDPNTEYIVKDPNEFTDEIKNEMALWIASDLKAWFTVDELKGDQRQLVKQKVDELIKHFCTRDGDDPYDKVRMLHVITPPDITQDNFKVRYISNSGRIETFEMNATEFYDYFKWSSFIGKAATAAGVGLATLGIAGISLAEAGTVSAGGALLAWGIGCCLATAAKIYSSRALMNTASRYHSLVYTKGLDRTLKAESAPNIILPVIANMHFIQQVPDDVRKNFKYGNNDPVDGSPFSELLKNINLMAFVVKNWENFETGCTNLQTREKNLGDLANFREKNIDDGLLKPVISHSAAIKGALMRWPNIWNGWAHVTTSIGSLGLVHALHAGAFLIDRLRGPWKTR